MKKLLILITIALLAACSSIVKVEGDQVVADKLAVKLPQAWNKLSLANNAQPYEIWTQEGVTLDQLRFWGGVASGAALANPSAQAVSSGKTPRKPVFVKGMPLDQLASQFEAVFAIDGSAVKVDKLDPAVFAGQKGLSFEFSITRQDDGVVLKGIGWAAEHNGLLRAMTYTAPRLAFFTRHEAMVRQIAASAQIKG